MTALAVAFVAFWGMARLGELVSDRKSKRQILVRDVLYAGDNSYMKIALYNAKTAKPGELQWLHLRRRQYLFSRTSMTKGIGRPSIFEEVHG